MSENKKTTEAFDQWAAWEESTYQTGSTQPPKSRGGLIAFLLGLVIFLCGISTALGLMNIRLRWQLDAQATEEACPVAFTRTTDGVASIHSEPDYFPLGFSGETVTDFWNLYEDIPQGIYITEVSATGDAAAKGVEPGDILLSVDQVRITDAAALTGLLEQYRSGDTVDVSLFRDGKQLTMQLKVD